MRQRARLALIRATEEALDRYPDRTVAVVRASLERSARRRTGSRVETRVILLGLTIRAMDVHPAVGRQVVRLWLRRARQQHQADLDRRPQVAVRLSRFTRTSQRQADRLTTD